MPNEIPFAIQARCAGKSMATFTAIFNGNPTATERYILGSGTMRQKTAMAWAADDRLRRNGTHTSTEDIASALEEKECQLLTQIAEAELANDSDTETPVAFEPPENSERPSQADLLVELTAGLELFHSPGTCDTQAALASISVDNHRETWLVTSKGFRSWLGRGFFRQYGKVPNAQSVQDALNVISGRALYDGPEKETPVRVAQHEGNVWLDLCDEQWRAVKVTPLGWDVVESVNVPVKFIRRRGMLALPTPKPGGAISHLREFVNAGSEDDFTLIVGFLIAALKPTGPYPTLGLNGEPGSAESTQCRFVRSLIDPNVAALRRPPRDERDVMIAASNSWLIALDNCSALKPWLSDTFCMLNTGGGFGCRELYSDGEEKLFSASRPIMINGIADNITASDLVDRSFLLTLPAIPEDKRRDEADLNNEFERRRPYILGALLDGVSAALRNFATVRLESKPRMADVCRWVTASEEGLGWEPGRFMIAYSTNRASSNELVLEASSVGTVLLQMMGSQREWTGRATDLLAVLETTYADEKMVKRDDWPKTPTGLGGQIRRLAPNLRKAGITVGLDERTPDRKRTRLIRLEKVGKPASAVSAVSAIPSGDPKTADSAGRSRTVADGLFDLDRPTENRLPAPENAVSDGSDGSDGRIHPPSGSPVAVNVPPDGGNVTTKTDPFAGFVPDGRTPERWIGRLEEMADNGMEINPQAAAKNRERAAGIRTALEATK